MLGKPEDFGKNKRAEQESKWSRLHIEKMYDQDENMFGEKIDLATGKQIENSTDSDIKTLPVVKPISKSEDVLPPLPEDDDEASKWLKKHGA